LATTVPSRETLHAPLVPIKGKNAGHRAVITLFKSTFQRTSEVVLVPASLGQVLPMAQHPRETTWGQVWVGQSTVVVIRAAASEGRQYLNATCNLCEFCTPISEVAGFWSGKKALIIY
jgi:hypothetical protein